MAVGWLAGQQRGGVRLAIDGLAIGRFEVGQTWNLAAEVGGLVVNRLVGC